jgi:hypothetical protein
MRQRYEYKFVRLGQVKFAALSLFSISPIATGEAIRDYANVIDSHAQEGWRLVQIFTPGTNMLGQAGFLELIFERPFELANGDDEGIDSDSTGKDVKHPA